MTGYDEALAVYHDTEAFSSCISVIGPFPRLPGSARGRRHQVLIEQLPRPVPAARPSRHARPAEHTGHRALLKRLHHPEAAEGERGVHVAAGRPPDRRVPRPTASASSSATSPSPSPCWSSPTCSASPRRTTPRSGTRSGRRVRGQIGKHEGGVLAMTRSRSSYERFTDYVEDRRREPRDDVMTGLATRRSRTARRPRSSMSSGSPPSSSPPGRRPPSASSAPRSS